MFLSLTNCDIRLIINFSHSFAKKGRRLIGRYDEGMSGGLLGFGNKIITEEPSIGEVCKIVLI